MTNKPKNSPKRGNVNSVVGASSRQSAFVLTKHSPSRHSPPQEPNRPSSRPSSPRTAATNGCGGGAVADAEGAGGHARGRHLRRHLPHRHLPPRRHQNPLPGLPHKICYHGLHFPGQLSVAGWSSLFYWCLVDKNGKIGRLGLLGRNFEAGGVLLWSVRKLCLFVLNCGLTAGDLFGSMNFGYGFSNI